MKSDNIFGWGGFDRSLGQLLSQSGVKLRLALLVLLVLIMAPAMALAAGQPKGQPKSDQPTDYGWHMPLTVSGKQGVVGLSLPPEVYLHAKSEQLHDLRVFDASGAPIPFAIHLPQPQTRAERRTLPARIFPVYGVVNGPANGPLNGQANQGGPNSTSPTSPTNSANQANPASPAANGPAPVELTIQTGANGGIVSVKARSATTQNRLHSLVLDFGAGEAGNELPLIDTLRFSAPPGVASQTGYSAQLWLEASDDLKQWEPLGTSELSWLANDANQTLANDRLKFEARRLRYARLSWRAGEPVLFASIEAEAVQQVSEVTKLAQITLAGSAGKNPQEWQYTLSRAIPVQKIGLQLIPENIIFPAVLGHYQELPSRQAGRPTTWRLVPAFQNTFYQLTQDGKTRRFTELDVPIRHADHWVLRAQGATAQTLASGPAPALTVYWQPAQLIFVTSGKAPYLLAFGRSKAEPGHLDLAQVAPGFAAGQLQALEQASAGAPRQMGSADADGPSAAAKANASAQQKTLILWAVLLLGVVVLALMVRSLLRQMKAKTSEAEGGPTNEQTNEPTNEPAKPPVAGAEADTGAGQTR